MILNFESFLEARLSDILNIKSTGDFSDDLKRYTDMDFNFNKNLTKYITLKERIGNKKVQFSIKWNDRSSHDLKQRINNRTSFKSVDEFNDWFKTIINKVFPSKVGKEIISTNDYSIYDPDYNISVIIYFDINKYINGDYEIYVKTLLPGRKGINSTKIVDI